jgi:Uma2 family endonuclease
MVIQHKPITADEFEVFLEQPENRDRLFELIDGAIVEKVLTLLRAFIVGVLAKFFGNYLDNNPFGWALIAARFRMPRDPKNAYVIDFSFVMLKEGRSLTGENPAPYMPELAVEVQSPGQSQTLMESKAQYYLANGTQIVWLIYPSEQRVDVLRNGEETRQFFKGDVLTGEDLLPGLQVEVDQFFKGV